MKKISKRILALALASVMVLSLAACGKEKQVDSDATYTYNLATDVFPNNWNPHVYETNTALEYALIYLQAPLYIFDFNEDRTGYELVPWAAVGDPEDLTADYVGQYGVEEGDTAKVWKFTLRDDLCWEDGTPITANDFVRSAELLLNPVAQNMRADDTFYAGNLKLVNAKNYLYSGQHAYGETMISANYGDDEYVAVEDMVVDENGVFTVDGKDIAFSLTSMGNWDPDNGMDAYYGAYPDAFVKDGVDLYAEVFTPAADEKGYVKVTEEIYEDLRYIIAAINGVSVADYEAARGDYAFKEWEEICWYGETFGEMDFSEVGIFALSDTELVLALESPLDGFYLKYSQTDSWLVNEDLYLKCESVTDGVYSNTYGTSAETTMSCGPYKMTSFQADKEIVLERNDNFFGITDGQYQTTTIKVQYVDEPSTRLEMFLSGQLDRYGLTDVDMEAYSTSDYTYYATGASTFFMAMNPAMEQLKTNEAALGNNFNKTILTVKEFRQALSYSLDRAAFALAVAPVNNAAYGVFSDLIIYDPEAGATYRSTDEAKQVLVDFWGLADEIGEGKMYADVDEAVASITGYNLEMAKQYFDKAYEIAVAEGLMDEDDVIEIKIGLYSTSNFQTKGYEFLVNNFTSAVEGTALEGKLTFTKDDTISDDFGGALRENRVDMLFGVGFSGAALDPYSLVQCYTTDDSLRYNICWDTENDPLTINLGGTDYTASVADWTNTLNGQEITITAADGTTSTFKGGTADGVEEERFHILAALEGAVLERFELLPLINDASAELKSMQTQMYSEEYIFGVGWNGQDGVQHLTYNYTDAEWDEYVASQGGKLTYN